MSAVEPQSSELGAPGPKWRRVRVRRKRPPTRAERLQKWFGKRWRKMRTWIVIGAMVVIGFEGFVSVRNYLDHAAASAEQ